MRQPTVSEAEATARLRGRDLDFSAMAAVSNLYRAGATIRSHMERSVLIPHGLSWAGWNVLFALDIWGRSDISHLAMQGNVSRASMTGILKTLEKRGLILRAPHPHDSRSVVIELTASGRALYESVLPEFNAQETRLTEALSEAEREQLAEYLRRLTNSAEEEQVQGAE